MFLAGAVVLCLFFLLSLSPNQPNLITTLLSRQRGRPTSFCCGAVLRSAKFLRKNASSVCPKWRDSSFYFLFSSPFSGFVSLSAIPQTAVFLDRVFFSAAQKSRLEKVLSTRFLACLVAFLLATCSVTPAKCQICLYHVSRSPLGANLGSL